MNFFGDDVLLQEFFEGFGDQAIDELISGSEGFLSILELSESFKLNTRKNNVSLWKVEENRTWKQLLRDQRNLRLYH